MEKGILPLNLPLPAIPLNWRIIFLVCLNCFNKRFTSWILVPLPADILRRRLPLIISGFLLSSTVMELIMAWIRSSCFHQSGDFSTGLLPQTGNHTQDLLQRTHVSNLFHLFHKIIQGKFIFPEFFFQFHGFLGIYISLCLFNQG